MSDLRTISGVNTALSEVDAFPGTMPASLASAPEETVPAWNRYNLVHPQKPKFSFTAAGLTLQVNEHQQGLMAWYSICGVDTQCWQIENSRQDIDANSPDSSHSPTAIIPLYFSHSDEWSAFPARGTARLLLTIHDVAGQATTAGLGGIPDGRPCRGRPPALACGQNSVRKQRNGARPPGRDYKSNLLRTVARVVGGPQPRGQQKVCPLVRLDEGSSSSNNSLRRVYDFPVTAPRRHGFRAALTTLARRVRCRLVGTRARFPSLCHGRKPGSLAVDQTSTRSIRCPFRATEIEVGALPVGAAGAQTAVRRSGAANYE
jgi:hypothetical protein